MTLTRAALVTLAVALASCAPHPVAPPVEVVLPPAAPETASAATAEPPPEEPAAHGCPSGTALVPGDEGRRVATLCVDVTEVTAGAYAACVKRGACDDRQIAGCDAAATYGKPGLSDHPLNCVSWDQANAYCHAVQKRLPTKEEWSWAAHGGKARLKYPWGDSDPSDRVCWSKGQSRSGTCRVGSFPAGRTPQGIDDMMGNLWEWASPAKRNGIPNVNAGGSWNNSDPTDIEGDNPGGFLADFVRNDVVGFRCVREASP